MNKSSLAFVDNEEALQDFKMNLEDMNAYVETFTKGKSHG